jgi:hypothetical protein
LIKWILILTGNELNCAGGESNTCGKRFSGQYGTLPKGYDHKYVSPEGSVGKTKRHSLKTLIL